MHEWAFPGESGTGGRRLTFTETRGFCRVHDGLIHCLYGEDTLETGMTVGEESHNGRPSESAAIVVVRLDRS
jgi:hypothetical protein